MSARLTVNLLTAALVPGDAIGHYILTLRRLLGGMGLRVRLYADSIHPDFPAPAQPSTWYLPTGQSVLWYHYSIGSPTIEMAAASHDFTIMDYHGVSPPALFAGYEPELARLCQQGVDLLPQVRGRFATHIVHSEFARQELIQQGYSTADIHTLPLVVDAHQWHSLAATGALADRLKQVEYLLFVGRIVPQKDILQLLKIFAAVHAHRPQLRLVLVGSRAQAGGYQQEIEAFVAAHGLQTAVLFTGQINNPHLLRQIMANARYLLAISEWESFCVPVVEAMACGVPAIIHPTPPLPEVAGEAGVLIDKWDVPTAAHTILNLLADPTRRLPLQTAALGRAPRFSDRALGQQLATFWATHVTPNGRLAI